MSSCRLDAEVDKHIANASKAFGTLCCAIFYAKWGDTDTVTNKIIKRRLE